MQPAQLIQCSHPTLPAPPAQTHPPTAKRLRQMLRLWGAASMRVLLSAATYALQPLHLYLHELNIGKIGGPGLEKWRPPCCASSCRLQPVQAASTSKETRATAEPLQRRLPCSAAAASLVVSVQALHRAEALQRRLQARHPGRHLQRERAAGLVRAAHMPAAARRGGGGTGGRDQLGMPEGAAQCCGPHHAAKTARLLQGAGSGRPTAGAATALWPRPGSPAP